MRRTTKAVLLSVSIGCSAVALTAGTGAPAGAWVSCGGSKHSAGFPYFHTPGAHYEIGGYYHYQEWYLTNNNRGSGASSYYASAYCGAW